MSHRTAHRHLPTLVGLLALLALAGPGASAEPALPAPEPGTASAPIVDWLPVAAFDHEPVSVALRDRTGWTFDGGSATGSSDGLWTVSRIDLPTTGRQVIAARGEAGAWKAVLVRPGGGAGLALDPITGQLLAGSDPVVLISRRREAAQDRRWAILRQAQRQRPVPCSLVLAAPPVFRGNAALPALIVAAQRIEAKGAAILLRLPDGDRYHGWGAGEAYARMLNWLLADLVHRGASTIVLVEPLAPAADLEAVTSLRATAQKISEAWAAPIIGTASLDDHACWSVAPGVLGETLNAEGRNRLDALLQPWLATSPPTSR